MFDQPPKAKAEEKIAPKYSPDDMSFEAQYSRTEKLKINGAEVDTVSIKPENMKTEVPVFVLHGWGASMESFKPGMKVLAEKGRPVVSLDFPRKGGDMLDTSNQEIAEWYKKNGKEIPKWPGEFSRQAGTISEFLDQEKIDKVDVIAHSMAGPSVVIAAMLRPEKFTGRTIILTNSAGLIGKDNIIRLAKGAGANTSRTPTMAEIPVTEKETEYLDSTKEITPEYMGTKNLWQKGKRIENFKKLGRAVKEVWDISKVQITEDMLRYLKEKGIKIIVVGGVEDTMFPMEGMQKNVPGEEVAGFVSVRGGHMQVQVNSQEGINPNFMSALESMLLQEKKT